MPHLPSSGNGLGREGAGALGMRRRFAGGELNPLAVDIAPSTSLNDLSGDARARDDVRVARGIAVSPSLDIDDVWTALLEF